MSVWYCLEFSSESYINTSLVVQVQKNVGNGEMATGLGCSLHDFVKTKQRESQEKTFCLAYFGEVQVIVALPFGLA